MSAFGLTRMQAKILEFIRTYIAEHGYSPSLVEIGVGVGMKATSKGAVFTHIQNLAARGRLTYQPGRVRSIALREDHGILVYLPPALDREVRALALQADVGAAAIVVECVRDRMSSIRSDSVSRETAQGRAA